jgi:hypothetical protein
VGRRPGPSAVAGRGRAYAEIAAQPGKAKLLAALSHVAPPIEAAASLGEGSRAVSPAAQRITESFLADELKRCVSRLLDREQFRAHCDRFGTRTAILENLA